MSVAIQEELAAAGLPPLPRLAWLEVDLSILEANARTLREALSPGARLGVVVKSDGYGHGLVAAARAALAGGAEMLVVATADEGLVLRGAGIDGRVLVAYAVPADQLAAAAAADLEVAVLDRVSLDQAVAFAGRRSGAAALRVHLGVDSGMTRGGFAPSEVGDVAATIAATPGLRLDGTWSHLAAPEDALSVAGQAREFQTALDGIAARGTSPALRHLAASGGLLGVGAEASGGLDFDLVRVGLAFYGEVPAVLPLGERGRAVAARLRSALRLLAHPVSIQEVPAGTGVGYGFEWRAARRSVIVTLPVGYADGWVRAYAPGSWATVRGVRAALVGRVSSDAVAVDATDAAPISPGDEFSLLGSGGAGEPTVAELAALRGTIAWEVIDGLGARLPRVYRRGSRVVGVRSAGDPVRWAG